jgi:hypothetical protein
MHRDGHRSRTDFSTPSEVLIPFLRRGAELNAIGAAALRLPAHAML